MPVSTIHFETHRENKARWVRQAQKNQLTLADWITATLNIAINESCKMDNPTPKQVLAARQAADHTQTEAAAVLGASMKTWQAWEYGHRNMPAPKYELYLIKTKQA